MKPLRLGVCSCRITIFKPSKPRKDRSLAVVALDPSCAATRAGGAAHVHVAGVPSGDSGIRVSGGSGRRCCCSDGTGICQFPLDRQIGAQSIYFLLRIFSTPSFASPSPSPFSSPPFQLERCLNELGKVTYLRSC